jgi:hypothetical protein
MQLILTIIMINLTSRSFQQIIFTFFLFDLDLFDNILMTMRTTTALQKVIAIADTILIRALLLNLCILNLVIIVGVDSNLGHCALSHLHLLIRTVNHH